jgi:hypothetical protein
MLKELLFRIELFFFNRWYNSPKRDPGLRKFFDYLVASGTSEQVRTFMFNAVRQHLTGRLFDKKGGE